MDPEFQKLFSHEMWDHESLPIWPITTFRLCRNLTGHPFPHRLSKERSQELLALLKNQLLSSEIFDNPTFVDIPSLSAVDRLFLLEHFFTSERLMSLQQVQGGLIDRSLAFFLHILADEHLSLHFLSTKNYWSHTWKQLTNIDKKLQEHFSFAQSPRFGFLTSKPERCGHALSIKAYLHLPALILTSQIDTALNKCVEKELIALNLRGENFSFIGDLVTLNNRYALGISESQLLQSLFSSATRLMNAEKSLRSHIRGSSPTRIKDRISRSFGILVHTVSVDTPELLNHLSLLKLGLDLGWVTGVTDAQINNAFFNARRGHLIKGMSSEKVVLEKIATDRANQIQDILAKVELNI